MRNITRPAPITSIWYDDILQQLAIEYEGGYTDYVSLSSVTLPDTIDTVEKQEQVRNLFKTSKNPKVLRTIIVNFPELLDEI